MQKKLMQKKTNKSVFWEYAEAIVTALVLALIIRAFVVQAFKIPSGSMEPTLLVGDHLLVNKIGYGIRIPFSDERLVTFGKPERDDVIVFKWPKDTSRDFIKRIIGLPGDVVEIRDKKVYVNGEPLDEPYVQYTDEYVRPARFGPRDNFGPVKVPQGNYFVMGDNRDQSEDSRYWGFVDFPKIKGKAMIIYWSWDKDRFMPRLGRIGDVVR
ncbi:MAG: signal peptidase I [Nitrospirota bacterium]|jgi:signal peptidase I